MSVFQIPQILGIMTLFKNCPRFRDKYFASHQQESSLPGNIPSLHPTRSCTAAVSGIGEKSIGVRFIPVGTFHSTDSAGQAHHWMLCSWGIRQQRFWPLSSEVRTIYQDSIPGSSCSPGGAALSQTGRGVGALEIVYLSLKHPILIFKCYKVLWC